MPSTGDMEVLRNAAQQWQVTFDAVGEPVFLLDADQRICRCNKAAQALCGKSAAEMEGHFCHEIVHGTTAPIPECPVLRVRHSLHREATELAIGNRCFNVTADPVLGAEGNLASVVHIVRDITDHKRAEEQLELLNQSLEGACHRTSPGDPGAPRHRLYGQSGAEHTIRHRVLPPAVGDVQRLELWARVATGRRQPGRIATHVRLLP